MHPLLHQPAAWAMFAMLGSAALTDLRSGLIPNALVAFGAGVGVLAQLVGVAAGDATLGATIVSMSVGLVACSIAPAALYAAGALGGGDLKLFAAIGLCIGPVAGLSIQLAAHLLATALLPFYFLRRGGGLRALRRTGRILLNPLLPAERPISFEAGQLTSMRFAPAIFVAALWVGWFGGVVP
jgi:prepilin peptidase CpaA